MSRLLARREAGISSAPRPTDSRTVLATSLVLAASHTQQIRSQVPLAHLQSVKAMQHHSNHTDDSQGTLTEQDDIEKAETPRCWSLENNEPSSEPLRLMTGRQRSTLLALPAEIRLHILGYVADDVQPFIACRYINPELGRLPEFRISFQHRTFTSLDRVFYQFDNECELPRVCRTLRHEVLNVLSARTLDLTDQHDCNVLCLAGALGMPTLLASRLCWDYVTRVQHLKLAFNYKGPPAHYRQFVSNNRFDLYRVIKHGAFPALQTVHVVMCLPSLPLSDMKGFLTSLTPRPLRRAEVECFNTVQAIQRQLESAGFRTRLEGYCANKLGRHLDRPGREFRLDLGIHVGQFSSRHEGG